MFGRMNLQDWNNMLFPLRRGVAKKPQLPKLPQEIELDTYEVIIYGTPTRITAATKSEARAKLKKMIGGKLPPGTVFRKVN